MQHPIHPECSLEDIDYSILSKIADRIGRNWRKFVSVIQGYSVYDVEDFARGHYLDEAPAMRVLNDLISQRKTVRQLISYLDQIHQENALLLLKGPEMLRLIKSPEGGRFTEGTLMTLECTATGFPYPCYQWYHVFCTADDEKQFNRLSEGTERVLRIDPVKPEHSGLYYCHIYHFPVVGGREMSVDTELVNVRIAPSPENAVGEAPVILQHPRNVTAAKGKPFGLVCRASGKPEPKYVWYKRGHNNIKLRHSDKVEWSQATEEDAGFYSCHVLNRCGAVWSNEVEIKVVERSVDKEVAIKIVRQPVESGCILGEKHTMECMAVCKVPLFYQWYKDDEKLAGCSENKLTFDAIKSKDAGRYYCKIWNESGSHQQSNSASLFLKSSSCAASIPGEGHFANDKIALLIGNMGYHGTQVLSAGSHDIACLQRTLTNIGFKFLSLMDLKKKEMETAIDLFTDLITEKSYVVFFFSGHGFQHLHRTYMVPVDAKIGYNSGDCICVQDVHRKFQEKLPALNNINLDLCRIHNDNETGPPNTTVDNKPLGNSVIFFASNVGSEAMESVGRDGSRPRGIFTDHFLKRIVQKEPLAVILEQVKKDVGNDPQVTNLMYPELRSDLRSNLSYHDPIRNQSIEARKHAIEFWDPLYLSNSKTPFTVDYISFNMDWTWTFSNVIRVEIKHDGPFDLMPNLRAFPEFLHVSDQNDQMGGKEMPRRLVWHIQNVQRATTSIALHVSVWLNNRLHQRRILFPEFVLLERWNRYRQLPSSNGATNGSDQSSTISSSNSSSSSVGQLCLTMGTTSINDA